MDVVFVNRDFQADRVAQAAGPGHAVDVGEFRRLPDQELVGEPAVERRVVIQEVTLNSTGQIGQ